MDELRRHRRSHLNRGRCQSGGDARRHRSARRCRAGSGGWHGVDCLSVRTRRSGAECAMASGKCGWPVRAASQVRVGYDARENARLHEPARSGAVRGYAVRSPAPRVASPLGLPARTSPTSSLSCAHAARNQRSRGVASGSARVVVRGVGPPTLLHGVSPAQRMWITPTPT
jgi:hypothetical protein